MAKLLVASAWRKVIKLQNYALTKSRDKINGLHFLEKNKFVILGSDSDHPHPVSILRVSLFLKFSEIRPRLVSDMNFKQELIGSKTETKEFIIFVKANKN